MVKVLRGEGFQVAALSRQPDSEAELTATGVRPVAGSMKDLKPYQSELRQANAIVVLGKPRYEKTLVCTSGTGVLGVHAPEGQWDLPSGGVDVDVAGDVLTRVLQLSGRSSACS